MHAGSIENVNIDNLQFNLVGQNSGSLDIAQATNALKLENVEQHATSATQNASRLADDMELFDAFLAEARSIRDSLGGSESPAIRDNMGSPEAPTLPTASASSTTSPAVEESGWSVDHDTNTINLDNGYRLSLDEANSQLLLEKVNDQGEVEKATKIFGDPHLDAGNDGTTDADFWKQSTLALEDGTKITIGTQEAEGTDMTFADKLTITKGDQAIEVSGLMAGADALNIGEVTNNGVQLDAQTNDGHVLEEGQANDWHLRDGTKIGQDSEYVAFAQEDVDNEVRRGEGWVLDPETMATRGENTVGLTEATESPTAVGGTSEGQPGQISDALRDFLEMQGIEVPDDGNDGILSADEWDDLIGAMESKQGGLQEMGQANLNMLLQMREMIAQMLAGLQLDGVQAA